ncbi:MAG: M23 family metallopeptidase [bacterium]|nr:M23 family metallopeptidase [bacterium]
MLPDSYFQPRIQNVVPGASAPARSARSRGVLCLAAALAALMLSVGPGGGVRAEVVKSGRPAPGVATQSGAANAATSAVGKTGVLKDLNNANPELKRLRREIADNLKATARRGRLRWPVRYVRYKLRPDENFYFVMAKVSQDADTIASLNSLANPNALGPGESILIPNARGLFLKAKDPATLAKKYQVSRNAMQRAGEFWFLAGQKYRPKEMAYFRGDSFLPPLKTGRVSSRFGMRSDPFTRRRTFHGGLDIAAPRGTAVHASQGGKVIRVASNARGYGKLIVIEHRFGYKTYYGHLSAILVRKGQKVAADQIIGRVGSTGRATGPHLHFEVRKNGQRRNPGVHGVRMK